jgi:hypothetical protein
MIDFLAKIEGGTSCEKKLGPKFGLNLCSKLVYNHPIFMHFDGSDSR